MKKYWLILNIVVIVGIAFIVAVFFHDPELIKQRPVIVYLDLDSLKEAKDSIVDTQKGPAVEKIFPANHQNKKDDTIPWADVYLCHSFSKIDSLIGDTLILVLDTKTDNSLYKIQYPDEYWTDLQKAPKYRKCRIVISPTQLRRIKFAKYKFARVELITDDD